MLIDFTQGRMALNFTQSPGQLMIMAFGAGIEMAASLVWLSRPDLDHPFSVVPVLIAPIFSAEETFDREPTPQWPQGSEDPVTPVLRFLWDVNSDVLPLSRIPGAGEDEFHLVLKGTTSNGQVLKQMQANLTIYQSIDHEVWSIDVSAETDLSSFTRMGLPASFILEGYRPFERALPGQMGPWVAQTSQAPSEPTGVPRFDRKDVLDA